MNCFLRPYQNASFCSRRFRFLYRQLFKNLEILAITFERYKGKDGAFSRITVFRNKAKQAPVLIIMTAMGVSANLYEPFAYSLVKQGASQAWISINIMRRQLAIYRIAIPEDCWHQKTDHRYPNHYQLIYQCWIGPSQNRFYFPETTIHDQRKRHFPVLYR